MSDGISLAATSEIFKINYDKKSENMYNSENVLQGRIKKVYDFVGSQLTPMVPLSYSGGVGSGRLPKANHGNYKQATITAKKLYATCEIEREAIYASANDVGAFVRGTAETVKKTVESYMRNASRVLFGDGSGVLGVGNGAGANVSGTGVVADPYVVEIPAASWKESNWEEQDHVQIVDTGAPEGGDTTANLLLVAAVDPVNRLISLVGTSPRLAALTGVGPLAATDEIAMQRSYGTDPMGLKGVLDATSGSLYGIPVQRRWMATQYAAGGRGVTPEMINNLLLGIKKRFGKTPNMIMTSYAQLKNMLDFMEDAKVYMLGNRNLVPGKELMGQWGFKGVEFMSVDGPIGVFVDRFCEDDRLYALNDNFIKVHHRPGFGWFTDDKTVFLRLQDDDGYGARYGGYYENLIVPTAHGVISGLAV